MRKRWTWTVITMCLLVQLCYGLGWNSAKFPFPNFKEMKQRTVSLCFCWCDLFYSLNCSKLQSEALREAITVITADCKEKKRNFTETIELQIGLKNYDPQKDKRFSGSVRLPHIPRPKMKICMLGDAQHVEEVY